jgi:hypothetical protein
MCSSFVTGVACPRLGVGMKISSSMATQISGHGTPRPPTALPDFCCSSICSLLNYKSLVSG